MLMLSLCVIAQKKAQEFFETDPVTKNGNVGLLIVDLKTDSVVDSYRANHLLPTASTMKAITTATALELLGKDYRYSTYLETSGTIEAGVLKGDLMVRGTGDPTLGSEKVGDKSFLDGWVKQIKAAGIKKIEGAVVADLTMWDNDDAANPDWPLGDVGNYYGMAVFPLSFMDNTLNVYLRSGAKGTMSEVLSTEPVLENLTFDCHVRCTDIGYDGTYIRGLALNDYRLITGELPSGKGRYRVRGDLPNPGLVLVEYFTRKLKEAGVEVTKPASFVARTEGKVDYASRTLLYEHKSPALSEIVYETNQISNNQYAEMIFRSLGMLAGNQVATIDDARGVVRKCWQDRGVAFDCVFQLDGCGLAPQNGVAPQTFCDIMRYMYKSANYQTFLESLPLSGETGTGKYFLTKTALHGKVYAKSGSISHLKSYTGYIFPGDGRELAFSIVVNNANGSGTVARKAIERYLLQFIYPAE